MLSMLVRNCRSERWSRQSVNPATSCSCVGSPCPMFGSRSAAEQSVEAGEQQRALGGAGDRCLSTQRRVDRVRIIPAGPGNQVGQERIHPGPGGDLLHRVIVPDGAAGFGRGSDRAGRSWSVAVPRPLVGRSARGEFTFQRGAELGDHRHAVEPPGEPRRLLLHGCGLLPSRCPRAAGRPPRRPGAAPQPPTTRPSHHTLGPMFPVRSNSAVRRSGEMYQSRPYQPIGVGSSAGNSAIHGSGSSTGSTSSASTSPSIPSRSTSTVVGTPASARRVSPRFHPVHQVMSAMVAGPNRASHRRTSSVRACSTSISKESVG